VPRFSVVTPVYNPPVGALADCLASIASQTHTDWEHCLVDDASTDPAVGKLLADAAVADPRVLLVRRTGNGGIGEATNDAMTMANGEFIVFVDHDDTISPDALADVACRLDADTDIDLLYTDEDKQFADGTIGDWFAKPIWSPERFRGQNYLCHLAVVRRSLINDVGGCRPGFDGSQDYDLLLRVSERARKIGHLSRFLYHWRVVPGSTAGDSQAKPAAYDAGRRALVDHCARVGIDATVTALAHAPGCYSVIRTPVGDVTATVVVPADGRTARVGGTFTPVAVATLAGVLESVPLRTPVVVAAAADLPAAVLGELRAMGGSRVRVVMAGSAGPDGVPAGRGDLVNRGLLAADTELCAVVDGVVPTGSQWLEALVALASGPTDEDVAAVGALVVRADGRIESAGINFTGVPVHDGHLLEADNGGPFGRFLINREVGAVSMACGLVRRNAVIDVGGFNPELWGIEADADLGCKLNAAGHRVVWTPSVQARRVGGDGGDNPVGEAAVSDQFHRRWARVLARDPFDPAGPARGREPHPIGVGSAR